MSKQEHLLNDISKILHDHMADIANALELIKRREDNLFEMCVQLEERIKRLEANHPGIGY